MAEIADLDEVTELAHRAGAPDIAIAMERLHDNVEEAWPDQNAVDEATARTTMPFYEDDRQDAFVLGTVFGTWLEEKFPVDEVEETNEREVESVQG